LFREHNEALVRFLFARLRSRQAALEVAQEAYVRLLSLDQPGAVSYLRSFLFKTAANLAVDRLRRDDVHARATETPLFRELTDDRTPERAAVGVEEIQRLAQLLTALPPCPDKLSACGNTYPVAKLQPGLMMGVSCARFRRLRLLVWL